MTLKLPPAYLLKINMSPDEIKTELPRLEKEIEPVWHISEAEIVLGKVNQALRARLELSWLGVETKELVRPQMANAEDNPAQSFALPARKKMKIDTTMVDEKKVITLDSDTESGSEEAEDQPKQTELSSKRRSIDVRSPTTGSPFALDSQVDSSPGNTIKVINIRWYYDSVKAGYLLPVKPPYLVYEGRIIPTEKKSAQRTSTTITFEKSRKKTPPPNPVTFAGKRRTTSPESHKKRRSQLVHEDTLDHEHEANMPPLPAYCKTKYCCQRPTPLHSPNDAFIAQLKVIRRARELERNEVAGHDFSVKSYSASIASIASYPYTIRSVAEIRRLRNCKDKVATAWYEWKETGEVQEVKEIEANERLNCLNLFYGIYQVGEATAREFYDKKGWRDLDDVVEYGWSTLTVDQKVGLKYYDELALRIPRSEVEATGNIVLEYANAIHPGFHMCIVGGYRRGKPDSGDMDFILSHPDESKTKDLLGNLLDALGNDKWITHELTVSTKNSERGQTTLAWRVRGTGTRSGFDTLDHAFVVWQNPNFEHTEENRGENPNPHRRVDIIISPWKTAGCAVLGWSGGTMFERDLRLYCREEKGWKFDSSGIRDLADGKWMDLESRDGEENGDVVLEEKEKRVFEGLGLEYRPPTERCTH